MAAESTIAVQIRTALAQYLKRDAGAIRPESRLREDLGLDSLAMIELLFKIEEHFDLEIPNEDLSRITTVADVTAYVEEKLAAAADAAPARKAAGPAPMPALAPVAATPPPAPVTSMPRPAPGARPVSAKSAKVTSIQAAAKRKAAKEAAKPAPGKKKGSRRA